MRDILRLTSECNEAWCVAGDFNNVLSVEDRVGGVSPRISRPS